MSSQKVLCSMVSWIFYLGLLVTYPYHVYLLVVYEEETFLMREYVFSAFNPISTGLCER
jgi:hypothetical protein